MASGSGKARKDAPRSTHRSPGSGDPEYSKFRFEPIEFDVQEILQAAKQTSKAANTHKSSVVNKHKAYKSSKGNVIAEPSALDSGVECCMVGDLELFV